MINATEAAVNRPASPRGQMLMHRVAGLVFVALAVMLIFSCVA